MTDDYDAVMGKDELTVVVDGEEMVVFNHADVEEHHYVNSVNGHETFCTWEPADSYPRDVEMAVTERLAEYLEIEWGIDPTDNGYPVVNVTDEEVDIL